MTIPTHLLPGPGLYHCRLAHDPARRYLVAIAGKAPFLRVAAILSYKGTEVPNVGLDVLEFLEQVTPPGEDR